jgi:hypothetical protein
MRLVKTLDGRSCLLDPLAHAQLSERSPRVVQAAMQDLMDWTDTLSVQALFRLHRAATHQRVTDKLLLLR